MATNKLTDHQIRLAKPRSQPFKLTDGAGLYLLVKPTAAKSWRLKYRFGGKEKLLTLGPYPEIPLAEARSEAVAARKLLREGVDPVQHRKAARSNAAAAVDTFQVIAEEWMASRSNDWKPGYLETVKAAVAHNLYPAIGDVDIRAISVPFLRSHLLPIEERGRLDTLRKVLMWASAVFRFAIATGRAETDPASLLRGTFKSPKSQNFPAITEPREFGRLISKIREVHSVPARSGLLLLAYTFVRTSELRGAEWKEIDFKKAEWRIPADRMKMGKEHVVPLSVQGVGLLETMKPFSNGRFVFPNARKKNKPMSENTLLYTLYELGMKGRMTGHGFRAAASSMLNELGHDADVIERQLAHQEQNRIRAAYHRADYLEPRKKMMQAWADYIDTLAGKENFSAKAYLESRPD